VIGEVTSDCHGTHRVIGPNGSGERTNLDG